LARRPLSIDQARLPPPTLAIAQLPTPAPHAAGYCPGLDRSCTTAREGASS